MPVFNEQNTVAEVINKVLEQPMVGELLIINDGSTEIKMDLQAYIEYVQTLDIGEIYLNSIDKDGTGFGYDFDTIYKVINSINVPLIIAGGAGNENHFLEGINHKSISAVATANLFNFIGNGLPNARNMLLNKNQNIANWNF